MTKKDWIITPDDMTLATPSGWENLGRNRYRAIRAHILIDKYREDFSKTGPVVHEQVLPAGSEFKIEQKQIIVRKNINTFSNSIHRALSTKISAEVAAKIGNELGFSAKGLAGKTSNEISTKFGTEVTESLSGDFSTIKSFEIESTEEFVRSLVLKVPEQGTVEKIKYFFYLPLWVWRWDLYLYKIEIVELTYRKNWLWQQIRESVHPVSYDVKIPLAQIMFYEPLDTPSVEPGIYTPEVKDAGEVLIRPVPGVCPVANNEDVMPLESFVPIAFPQNKVERADSRRAGALVAGAKKTPSSKIIERLESTSKVSKGGGDGKSKQLAKDTKTGMFTKHDRKISKGKNVKGVRGTIVKDGSSIRSGIKSSGKGVVKQSRGQVVVAKGRTGVSKSSSSSGKGGGVTKGTSKGGRKK